MSGHDGVSGLAGCLGITSDYSVSRSSDKTVNLNGKIDLRYFSCPREGPRIRSTLTISPSLMVMDSPCSGLKWPATSLMLMHVGKAIPLGTTAPLT